MLFKVFCKFPNIQLEYILLIGYIGESAAIGKLIIQGENMWASRILVVLFCNESNITKISKADDSQSPVITEHWQQ